MKYEENVSSVRTPTPVLHLRMAERGGLFHFLQRGTSLMGKTDLVEDARKVEEGEN